MAALHGSQSEARFFSHWDPGRTALNNGGGLQGDALELTWSVIPDGTIMPATPGIPETTCASNLIATFNAVYGAGVWQAEMQNVWNDWTGKTGNVYTPAVALNGNGTPIDDGAVWPTSPGVAGVRGDLRIGGCAIDGDFNTVAYNFSSNNGDMKIESTDAFFSGKPVAPAFHNVFSHEHGHGVGLGHVCPLDNTKLMEPLVNLGFTGLQHDDIRGAQRGYGDRFEVINNPNDTQGAATVLAPLGGQTENTLSLDSTGDTDWFQFPANAGDTLDMTVTPNGLTYPEGLCTSATPVNLNSLALQDLAFEIRDGRGVLTTVNATGAGAAEATAGFAVATTETHYVRVFGTGTDDTQIYNLFVNRTGPTPGFSVGFSGDDQIAVGSDPLLRITGDMTWELWLRPTDTSARRNPLAKAYSGEGTITQETDGRLSFYQGEGGGNTSGFERLRSSPLQLGVWSHVVITRSGTTLTWYVNGVADTTKTATKIPAASTLPLTIGDGYVSGYVGGIDEVAVYGRALTPTEITDHYNTMDSGDHVAYGTVVTADSPVSYWRLDETGGPVAIDTMGTNPGSYQGTPGYQQPGATIT